MNEYMKVLSFSFVGHSFWKKSIEGKKKLVESEHFQLLSKDKNGYVAENRS